MVSGISQFGFVLSNGDYLKRGRYLESLQFQVDDTHMEDGVVHVSYSYGFYAPKATTYSSNIQYSMTIQTFGFITEDVQVTKMQKAVGEICISDWEVGLNCKM